MWNNTSRLNSMAIKLQPPEKLPVQGVTRALFKPWKNHMVNFMSQDLDNHRFLEQGDYGTWRAFKDHPAPYSRIPELAAGDDVNTLELRSYLGDTPEQWTARPQAEKEEAKVAARKEKLSFRNAQLSKMIQVVNCYIHTNEQFEVDNDCTSLTWIFDFLEKRYNIQSRRVNLLRLADCKYKSGVNYQTYYRELYASICDNLRRKDDNDLTGAKLKEDEQISPTFKDYIILTALHNIDPRLPDKVKQDYELQLTQKGVYLSDIQTSIFQAIPAMLESLTRDANLSSLASARSMNLSAGDPPDVYLDAFSFQGKPRGQGGRRGPQGQRGGGRGSRTWGRGGGGSQAQDGDRDWSVKYCRLCKVNRKPQAVFESHNTGQCGFFTNADRRAIRAELNAMNLDDDAGEDEPWTDEQEDQDQVELEATQGSRQQNYF